MTGYIPKMTFVDRAERQRKVAAMIEGGASAQEAADKHGITPNYVRKIARLYGVNRPQGRPDGWRKDT